MNNINNLEMWWQVFTHFAHLSLLAVGGAITTAPDMHRYLVEDHAWLTDSQFSSSIALSQAAPGPNVLFIAVLGWNLGWNSGHSVAWALLGVGVCLFATLLPSSILTYTATRWAHQNRDRRSVKAFKQGLAPVVIALLLATGWLLSSPMQGQSPVDLTTPFHQWMAFFQQQPLVSWALTTLVVILICTTRIHMLWLLGLGAWCGVMEWV
jgi:chromate transporter